MGHFQQYPVDDKPQGLLAGFHSSFMGALCTYAKRQRCVSSEAP